jgi:TonB family protein
MRCLAILQMGMLLFGATFISSAAANAKPDTPAKAQQQGIQGTVQVSVSLNVDSQVVGACVQTSPSALLDNAALAAARQSTFQTEIRDCKPIAADYIYPVDFTSQ